MIIRQFSKTMWRAVSPSAYVCVKYPAVQAFFDGRKWSILKVLKSFTSMIDVSRHVEKSEKHFAKMQKGVVVNHE